MVMPRRLPRSRTDWRETRARGRHLQQLAELRERLARAGEALERARLDLFVERADGVVLKRGEVAYLMVSGVALVEPRHQPGSWSASSSGWSFRVAKGITYRMSGTQGRYQPGAEVPVAVDTGRLTVTNLRCFFAGRKRTLEWSYAKLLGYSFEVPGTLVFNVSNRQKASGVAFGESLVERVEAVIAAGVAKFHSDAHHEAVVAEIAEQYRDLQAQLLAIDPSATLGSPSPPTARTDVALPDLNHDDRGGSGTETDQRAPTPTSLPGGIIERGSHLSSLGELIETLAQWLDHSDDSRLADTTYGRVGWLTVDTPLGTMTINADTRRDAIESLVDAARSASGLRMNVIANRRGRVNKVTFDNCPTQGWYAYIDPPLSTPASHPTT